MPTVPSAWFDHINHVCTRKRRYQTRKIARRVAKRMNMEGGPPREAYRCPYCQHFHVGKKQRSGRAGS